MSAQPDKEDLERFWSAQAGGSFPGSRPVTAVVLGCGVRGKNYAWFALDFPRRLKIVAGEGG